MITLKYAKECFDYDPLTGSLTWKLRPRKHFDSIRGWRISNTGRTGKAAGTLNAGIYLRVYMSGVGVSGTYLASHLIFLLMTGELPTSAITYKDHDSLNLKWENLTAVRQLQHKNISAFIAKSIYTGLKTKRFRVQKVIDGKRTHVGTFDNYQDAVFAAENINKELYFNEEGYVNVIKVKEMLSISGAAFKKLSGNDPVFPPSIRVKFSRLFKRVDIERYALESTMYKERIIIRRDKKEDSVGWPKLPKSVNLPGLACKFARGGFSPVAIN